MSNNNEITDTNNSADNTPLFRKILSIVNPPPCAAWHQLPGANTHTQLPTKKHIIIVIDNELMRLKLNIPKRTNDALMGKQ